MVHVSTVPCDLVIYLYVTGFMVCLLDWKTVLPKGKCLLDSDR